MSQDAFGNYIANIQSAGIVFAPDSVILSGSGIPPDTLGDDGSIYVDLDTGTIYSKTNGSWSSVVGGGGSAGLVGVVDPEGVVTADPGTPYTNKSNHTFWVKESGAGNTGWLNYI